jgi:methylmalonyl-CoA mutase cobalamin-binding subunit
MGVAQVFTPGATMSEIVAWVRANVGTARRI